MKPLSNHIFDAALDLNSANLVEASAGTGKTYSIQTLYLRMVVAQGIPVQQLLVVTFTEAATKELRDRLHEILEKCRRQLEPGQELPAGDDDRKRIDAILSLPPVVDPKDEPAAGRPSDFDFKLRRSRVRRALLDFDQAAIFTIHGFCQRALQEFAFECSHDFDAEVTDGSDLLHELCADWWRQIQYGRPTDLMASVFRKRFPDVAKLTNLASSLLKRPLARVLPAYDEAADPEVGKRVSNGVDAIVGLVRENHLKIEENLTTPVLSAPFFPLAQQMNIARLMEKVCDAVEYEERIRVLAELNLALRPGKIPNPVLLPAGVQNCLEAVRICEEKVNTYTIKVAKKTDDWPLTGARLQEWLTLVNEARNQIRGNRATLEEFIANIINVAPFFNQTELLDADVRKKRFDILVAPASCAKEVLTALTGVASVKPKDNVSWKPGAEAQELLGQLASLEAEASKLCLGKLGQGLQGVVAQFDQRLRESHGMTYDDMLKRLQQALSRTETADRLREQLRKKYVAALIDEFQDTDPVQYRIFETLFFDNTTPLFFVGDPKQAIYSFRGGDIYTYCAARSGVCGSHHYSLDTNFRSQALLIDAVNTVFKDRDGESLFGRADISYAGDLKCRDLGLRFVDKGEVDERPFKIWDYRKSGADNGKRGKCTDGFSSAEARQIYADVAEEVVRLLSKENVGFVPRGAKAGDIKPGTIKRLRPSDIAILVRRHAEAAYLYRELRRRGVPAVRQAGDNVFDSPEAVELLYLLQAMMDPGRIPSVLTALASALLPVSDQELAELGREEPAPCAVAGSLGIRDFPENIEKWLELFRDVADAWGRCGFAVAFNMLVRRTGMKVWLASQPGGERSLVNVVQLQDILHNVATSRHLAPEALLGWYERQVSGDTRDEDDAFETRLESDADAVQIMTIFKSKGLEFPVVFVPTMWTGMVGRRMAVCRMYHETTSAPVGDDGSGKAQLPAVVLQLDKDEAVAKAADNKERNEEDRRNLYVAATRASYRTYVIAGDLGAASSTVARCLPRDLFAQWEGSASGIEVISKVLGSSVACSHFQREKGIKKDDLVNLPRPALEKPRTHASFSSIAPQGAGPAQGSEAYDFDDADATGADEPSPAEQGLTVLTFPPGARTGECWHRIFELLDFGAEDEIIRAVVDEQLALFRLDKGSPAEKKARQDVTFQMVKRVLGAELAAGKQRFCLKDVARAHKLHEVAFDFSLRAGGPALSDVGQRNAIWQVLNEAWKDAGEATEEALFLGRLKHWDKAIPEGFMTGFIDLFFEHQGQYYILDWKSNRLDGKAENFDRERGMAAEMSHHAYFLQYLLYTVAMDRYLQQCLGEGYDYDKHFGGVLYLFVRGIGTSGQGSQRGVYYTRPAKVLVDQLAQALMSREEGAGLS